MGREEPDTFLGGEKYRWQMGRGRMQGRAHKLWQSMGCQRFRRKMLEKILGRGGGGGPSYTGQSLGLKGPSARQTTGLI